jgi:O-antigen polymerase
LLVNGFFLDEWVHFSYPISLMLVSVVLQNLVHKNEIQHLYVYLISILCITVLIHVAFGLQRGYLKYGFFDKSFVNTGQYASYLMMFFPTLLAFAVFEKSRLKRDFIIRVICGFTSSLILTIAFFNQARTCWIAGIIVIILYAILFNNLHKVVKKIHIIKWMPFFIGLLLIAYFLKKDSADGRILIYKLSFKMFTDNFFFGVGFNRFEAHYNLYQAAYFQKYNDIAAAWLADDIAVAYNEIIQSLGELGISALIIWIIIGKQIITSFRIFFKKETIVTWKNSAFIGFVIASLWACLFTYPLSIIEITNALFINILFLTIMNGE